MFKLQVQIVVCLLLLLGASSCSVAQSSQVPTSGGPVSEKTFATPEEAITYYFEGVQQQNMDKILLSTATKEMAQHFDFEAFSTRIGAVMFSNVGPSNTEFLRELNRLKMVSDISQSVKYLTISLLVRNRGLFNDQLSGPTKLNDDGSPLKGLVADMDTSRLSALKVLVISPPTQSLLDQAAKNFDSTAKLYGADSVTERLVLISFENRLFTVGFQVLKYGTTWKVKNQYATLFGTSPLGDGSEITQENFEKMLK